MLPKPAKLISYRQVDVHRELPSASSPGKNCPKRLYRLGNSGTANRFHSATCNGPRFGLGASTGKRPNHDLGSHIYSGVYFGRDLSLQAMRHVVHMPLASFDAEE